VTPTLETPLAIGLRSIPRENISKVSDHLYDLQFPANSTEGPNVKLTLTETLLCVYDPD